MTFEDLSQFKDKMVFLFVKNIGSMRGRIVGVEKNGVYFDYMPFNDLIVKEKYFINTKYIIYVSY